MRKALSLPCRFHLGLLLLGMIILSLSFIERTTSLGAAVPTKPETNEPAPLTVPFTAKEAKEAQTAWAKFLHRDVEEEIDLGNGTKLTVILTPPGRFTMGSPNKEDGRSGALVIGSCWGC